MLCDEYGQPRKTKLSGPMIKVNLCKIGELWRKLRGPRKRQVDKRLLEAKQRAMEWQALVEKERLSKEELKQLLELRLRDDLGFK